jgi:hypothetical protein
MALERSKGKLRPTLPRSSDLGTPGPVDERRRNHDAGGRFAPGNEAGRGRGWRSQIRKGLQPQASTPEVERVFRDAWGLHCQFMRELPFTGAQVSQPTAARARWAALSQYYVNRAAEVGLETDTGRQFIELAMRLDQRAERLAVTSFDLATKLAEATKRTPASVPWLTATPRPADAPAEPDDSDTDDEPPSSARFNVEGER